MYTGEMAESQCGTSDLRYSETMNKNTAIWVRGLTKKYGTSSKAQLVLDELDMTVDKGTIYGLLGASGCGKTTLLTCLVGRRNITAGEVWILGGKPGSRKSGVPGPQLGYMPQEIALMRQFTISDAVYHFGWIYGMNNKDIEERLNFLSDLLELPSLNTKVDTLSGGQQRRVSMAVALIQDPELIILDEPTVGLDPVLRDKIWKYLKECVTQRNRTVIITTHYIEEARQAHKVGLMRNGKLMAEDSPQKLMEMYECEDLEHVFLKLSGQQEKISRADPGQPSSSQKLGVISVANGNEVPDGGKQLVESTSVSPSTGSSDAYISNSDQSTTRKYERSLKGHAKALLSKNWYRITRHPGAIIFVFLFPMVELCSFYLAIGGNPQGLKLGVVNEELGNFTSCEQLRLSLGSQYGGHKTFIEDGLTHCELEGLSCKFLEKINDDVVVKTPYSDISTALSDAKKGRLLAVIHFLGNFSKAFENRIEAGGDTTDDVIEESQIALWLDMSQRQSALLLERRLLKLQVEWLNETLQECEINPHVGSVPVKIYPAIYGSPESGFNQFMTPGVVTTMIFFLAVSITSTIMLVERLDGVWDRTLLAGVSSVEILVSHILLESGVICLQVLEVFIFVFFIFGMPCAGRYIDIVILLVLQGFCGMCGGFLVSVSVNSVTTSNFVSMGGFYPILVFSGLLWPIEGMPGILKKIAVGMPTTMATLSLRNIMEKGWTLTRTYVYEGYLISIAWIIFFSAASIVVVRARK